MALDSNSTPSTDRSVGLGVITQAQTQILTSDTQHAGYTLQKIHVLRIRGDLLPLKRSGLCYFSPNMWFPFCTMRLPKFGWFKARISRGWRLRLEPSSPRAVGSLSFFFFHLVSPLISAIKPCPVQPVPTWLLNFCLLSQQEACEHLPGMQLFSST